MSGSVSFKQPDVTLGLDLSGVICRATVENEISSEVVTDWVGRLWADTVASGNDHVRQMVDTARTIGTSPVHRVRQRFPSGLELAVEYTTIRSGKRGLLAVGRNLEAVADVRARVLAAEVAMERELWRLRQVETRYRLLFDSSEQPALLVGDDLRIVDANRAALKSLGIGAGCDLLPEILTPERQKVREMIEAVRKHGKALGVVVHLSSDRQPWLVRASSVEPENGALFLLQLTEASDALAAKALDRNAMDEIIRDRIGTIEQLCVDLANKTRRAQNSKK